MKYSEILFTSLIIFISVIFGDWIKDWFKDIGTKKYWKVAVELCMILALLILAIFIGDLAIKLFN